MDSTAEKELTIESTEVGEELGYVTRCKKVAHVG
jgi:hypothetical protein